MILSRSTFEHAGGLDSACEPQVMLHVPMTAACSSPVCVINTQMPSSAGHGTAACCAFCISPEPDIAAMSSPACMQCSVRQPGWCALQGKKKNPPPPRDPKLPPKPKGQTVGSFREGLQQLPRAIAAQLQDNIRQAPLLWQA